MSKEKAKNNGFSARLWASLLKVVRLGLRNGKAEAARDRSFGDVPDQPGGGISPNYFGR